MRLSYNTPAGDSLIDETYDGFRVVTGKTVVLTGSFTRPADTTAYTANDQVANSTSAPVAGTITSIVRGTGMGAVVLGATLLKSTNVTTNASFRARLFSAAPVMANDNAAYSPALASLALCLGHIDFSVPIAGADCVRFVGTLYSDRIAIANLAATTLWWNLQALGAYTPGSAEAFSLILSLVQD